MFSNEDPYSVPELWYVRRRNHSVDKVGMKKKKKSIRLKERMNEPNLEVDLSSYLPLATSFIFDRLLVCHI